MTGVFLSPSQAIGEEMDFFPRILDFGGALEVGGSLRDYKRSVEGHEFNTKTDLIYERLKLGAIGYVYHPRFMTYSVRGAATLNENSFDTERGSRSRSRFADEYEMSTTFLPEHPYNFHLFRERKIVLKPLLVGSPDIDRITTLKQGASFQYNAQPASLQLHAVSTSYDNHFSSQTKRYSATGSYLIGPFNNSAGYSYSVLNTDSMQGTYTTAYFSNSVSVSVFGLSSSVAENHQLQEYYLDGFSENESFLWTERLTAELPLNLSVGIFHDIRQDSVTSESTVSGVPEMDADTRTASDGIRVDHQLYRSLRTSYDLQRLSLESDEGDTKSIGQTLAVNYSKIIPSGTVNAGYTAQHATLERSGATTIAGEFYTTAVPGSFTLSNQAVDTNSITVMIKDPVTLNLVLLPEGTSYEVLTFGNSVQITILNVPAGVNPPPPPITTFDFSVTYSLAVSASRTQTWSNGINLGLMLLDGLLNPYFSYFTSNQEVVSGTFSEGNETATSRIIGYTVQKAPFVLTAEESVVRSNISPSRAWRTAVDYREYISQDVNVFARISYNVIKRAASGEFLSKDYSEQTTGMDVSIQKTFSETHMNLFAGGSYVDRKVGDISIANYGFNTGLRWHVGKLDVSASGALSHSASARPSGRQTAEAVSYSLTVSRKIF